MIWVGVFSHIIFVLLLGYYLIQNLQWYNYRFSRILLHHHNNYEHIYLFLAPLFVGYIFADYLYLVDLFYLFVLWLWQKKIDKRLVWTWRVRRFFVLLFFLVLIGDLLCILRFGCSIFPTLIPLILASLLSGVIEQFLFMIYKRDALKKLSTIDPTIVAITASYGKTSIKNFLAQLLKDSYKVYKTPRSVNTLGGIVKDINELLPEDVQIYIVEAGARQRGDIAQITAFLHHHFAIIAKVGSQHIEYFHTLENIIATKLELLGSKRLKKAFIWDGIEIKERSIIEKFGNNIKNINATLEKLEWDLELDGHNYHFEANILGAFNALNITAALLVAKELGVDMKTLQERVKKLTPIEHRLQRIDAGGKIIIDDSFNGNLEGMRASYELLKGYEGRKVIVTPGIVESDEESNKELAKKIDEVFDLVIITGKINRKTLFAHITKPKIVVEDKSKLQAILAEHTRPKDLILFSNDTPGFM